jgi:hypothetical protein
MGKTLSLEARYVKSTYWSRGIYETLHPAYQIQLTYISITLAQAIMAANLHIRSFSMSTLIDNDQTPLLIDR